MSHLPPGHGWRIPDELWVKLQPLLPPGKPHPLGGHRPRVDDRKAMDAIFYRLRTGCQWKALDATGICSSSSTHRRFQEWTQSGVFGQLWAQGLLDYDELKGLDWEWQAMDGAMTKAPLGQEKTGPNPTDRAKRGVKRSLLVEGHGVPIGLEVEGANRNDFKMLQATLQSIPITRPEPTDERKQNLCLDKGYDYNEVRDLGKEFGYTLHIRARKVEKMEKMPASSLQTLPHLPQSIPLQKQKRYKHEQTDQPAHRVPYYAHRSPPYPHIRSSVVLDRKTVSGCCGAAKW